MMFLSIYVETFFLNCLNFSLILKNLLVFMYLKNIFAHLLSVVLYGQKLLCHLRFHTKGGG